jgi:hypothetical protein
MALLESSEADKFVAQLYQARKQYRLVCERPNKGNKAIEREVISSYQIAQSLGFRVTSAPGSTCCGFTRRTARKFTAPTKPRHQKQISRRASHNPNYSLQPTAQIR